MGLIDPFLPFPSDRFQEVESDGVLRRRDRPRDV